MFFHLCIALSSLLLSSFASLTSSSTSASLSIYEVLRSHGLPMGLLPKGVTDFIIDDNGRFEVYLDQACNAKFESELHYDRNVSGSLSYGQIGELSGISAQELFLWFPVKGIRVDVPSSGLIYFDVGVVFKQFSLSLFETPPNCKAVRGDERPEESNFAVTNFLKLKLVEYGPTVYINLTQLKPVEVSKEVMRSDAGCDQRLFIRTEKQSWQ